MTRITESTLKVKLLGGLFGIKRWGFAAWRISQIPCRSGRGLIYGVLIIVVCACLGLLWLQCEPESPQDFLQNHGVHGEEDFFFSWLLIGDRGIFFSCWFFSLSKMEARSKFLGFPAKRYTFHQINSIRLGGECVNLATASRWY